MGRSAIFKSFEHMPKLLFDFFVIQFHKGENFMLNLGNINAHTSTTDLVTVANDVVLLRTNIQRIAVEPINVRLVQARERIGLGSVTLTLFIKVQKWEINAPT